MELKIVSFSGFKVAEKKTAKKVNSSKTTVVTDVVPHFGQTASIQQSGKLGKRKLRLYH